MKFKVGDKVKFLNETGGGIVSKIVSGSLVYVATEDGFELPTATRDIIRMEAESKAEKMFSEDFDVDLNAARSTHGNTDDPAVSQAGKIKSGAEETPGFYLAFVPTDQQWYIMGEIEVRIINHSRNDILYNILLEDDEKDYFGFEYGSVEAGSSTIIDTIDREALPDWSDGVVQLLLHDEGEAFLPIQSSFHIKAVKFNSEGSYQPSGFMEERAIIYRLAEFKASRKLASKKKAVKLEEDPVEVKASEHKRETMIGRHATGPHVAVVDLHIGEIVDNIAGLSSHDMFLLQLNYFVKTLESAMEHNFRKVTYIHGVGNGVLKNAIIEKLKDYKGLENKSASLAEFGQGAVDVMIHVK
ncbi:MAG: DUF2027 domain-containing protein [Bacteroidota bacterium]